MAKYIGNIPSVGEFKKLDSLTSTFNGSLTQFNLEYGSTSVSVGDASQLIVSLNGIIQEPLTAYTLAVGGSAIVFSSAPASTDTCHIILLGGVGGTSTVSDGAVTAAKLDAGLKDYLEETYTANGSQTTYTLTRAPIGTNDLMITIDGIVQPSTAYSVAGTTLTISPALPNGTDVRVVHMGVRAGFVVPSSSSITAAMFQDFTTDVKFNDNAKALFGTGDDLQIYHDGTHSYVADAGGGSLVLSTNGSTVSINTDGPENMAIFRKDGSVDLFHNNSKKFETTSTGIDVTGTVTSDGLTVQSNNYLDIHDADNHVSGRLRNVSGSNNALAIEADPNNSASGSFINFKIDASEKMRIDSSGNLLVGMTSDAANTVGIRARSEGLLTATRDGSQSAIFGRKSSDGDIALFQKDGTTVGSIGTSFGDITIGGKSGLRFDTDSSQYVIPYNVTDNAHTTTVDLGTTDRRFKDLYLSGGVYLGGTGAVNKLSDYETGGWTPTLTASGYTFAYLSGTEGRYVKIGSLVHINGYIRLTANPSGSGTVSLIIEGLPFTISPVNASSYTAGSMIVEGSGSVFSGIPALRPNNNTTQMYVAQIRAGQSPLMVNSINVANITSTMEFEFQITYHTQS